MRRVILYLVCAMLLALAGPVLAGQTADTGAQCVSVGDFDPVPDGICRATASCWDGTIVTCSGASSASTCVSVDASCPSQRGYVKCDSTYTWCPSCPVDECSREGDFCFADYECLDGPECEGCFCMTLWERPVGDCVCP
jgi:hypothetical protein